MVITYSTGVQRGGRKFFLSLLRENLNWGTKGRKKIFSKSFGGKICTGVQRGGRKFFLSLLAGKFELGYKGEEENFF